MSLVRHDLPPLHLPARAREVYDVTGAGDTVIAVLGVAIGAGSDLPTAMAVANLAAGIVVGKLGTAGTTVAELEAAMHGHSDPGWGVLDRAELVAAVAQAREAGNRVVMTNGCFDILHAGHVHYLSRAKALGDRLVVAVNDDASVGRLKGKGRPINTTANRMQVLAALECVDWVVPFSEDTPASLIHEVLPDVLVKGGDWHVDDVAGGDRVRENGGRVETLDYQEGFSTTGIIEAAARIVKARGNGG